ncbi:hypothetical protein [Nocardia asiatica]|uniref:hypothetical protein n=1 Tax=Nocardia asiatica TaxID=209252 RepID=UPI002455D5A3|nr:hypothetical protein [Nocardia asiatica]
MTRPPIETWAATRLARLGYVDPAPTRARLIEIHQAGVSMYRLARITGVSESSLETIRSGAAKFAHPDHAATITKLDISEIVEIANPTPYVDDIVLNRLLGGKDIKIASRDKPLYARALYGKGWHKTRISRALGMSGASVNKALAA